MSGWTSPNHAFEFLLTLRDVVTDTETRDVETQTLWGLATRTTAAYDAAMVGGTKDPHKSVLDAFAEQNERLKQLRARRDDMIDLASALLGELSDEEHRVLLLARYRFALTWSGVDKALTRRGVALSKGGLWRAHNAALDEVDKIWREHDYDNKYRQIKERYGVA
jgi:hypothetical protein